MTSHSSPKTKSEFEITFWGTRGTLATPDIECSKAGGNTACVEVRCGERTIVCDAGTGIRRLGSKIIAAGDPKKIELFITHAHYDHVEGIPFFAPLFSSDYEVGIWCGELEGARNTKDMVEGFMRRPYFPVGPEIFSAKLNYHTLKARQSFDLGKEIIVKTIPLTHPGGATAYRIEFAGKSFCYVTDTEHQPGETNHAIIDFIRDTDLFVYDASLSDEELPRFKGYGHSTWEEGLRLAQKANAKQYLAFHHMPFRNDDDLDKIDKAIDKVLPGSGVARENYKLKL